MCCGGRGVAEPGAAHAPANVAGVIQAKALCGVQILSDMGVGTSRAILEHLAKKTDKGQHVHIGGSRLAKLTGDDKKSTR